MPSDRVVELQNESEFEQKCLSGLVVIDFFTTWCGPCKVIAPKFDEFAGKYPNFKFFKVNTEEIPKVAAKFSVKSIPTFVFLKDGKEVARVVGGNAAEIEKNLQSHA